MKDQINTIREGLERATRYTMLEPDAQAVQQALTALSELEAMVGEQEPVAWMVYTLDGESVCVTDNPDDFTEQHKALPLYAAPVAQQPQAEAVPSDVLGSEWAPCIKRPVVVHVRNQRPGEKHVSTREGITPVKPDDLIMRGVSGEEYPIGRAIFDQTYDFVDAAIAQQKGGV